MNERETLPSEMVFQPDGHVTDVALTALTDGEEGLLPASVGAHVDGCEVCTERLAESALFAVETALSFKARASLASDRALVPAALAVRPLPKRLLAAALLLAAAGSLPALLAAPARLRELLDIAVRAVPILLRSFLAATKLDDAAAQTALVSLSCFSTVLLLGVGALVLRASSRRPALLGDAS